MMQWSDIRKDIQQGLLASPDKVKNYALMQIKFWQDLLEWAEKMQRIKN